jgi:radical SAM superfamily enzyme YgiQ (UPF0313 family)
MLFTPISYNEPVFRPPAEANSVIIQATIGCSWNRCAFCEMYTRKKFRMRKWEELQKDIALLANINKGVKKVFLADGNPFVLSYPYLAQIAEEINIQFGKLQRISAYALPQDIIQKSDVELQQLRDLGIRLLYLGIESGNNEVLKNIDKSETFDSTVEGILKAHSAGIDTSVMVINGLGGRILSHEHAIDSARLVNQLSPKFLSLLTLSLPFGEDHFIQRYKGRYIQQTVVELYKELELFIKNLELKHTIFRTDHISNNLILKGNLPRDKEAILTQIKSAINLTDKSLYPVTSGIL